MNSKKIRLFRKQHSWYDEQWALKDINHELEVLNHDRYLQGISDQGMSLIMTEIKSLENIKKKIFKEYPEFTI